MPPTTVLRPRLRVNWRAVTGPGSRGQRYLCQPEILWLWPVSMGGGFCDQGVELEQSPGLGEIAWAP